MKGKPITKVERIMQLASARKAVYHTKWDKPCPAAVMVGMPVRTVAGFIRMGWLFEYIPKK